MLLVSCAASPRLERFLALCVPRAAREAGCACLVRDVVQDLAYVRLVAPGTWVFGLHRRRFPPLPCRFAPVLGAPGGLRTAPCSPGGGLRELSRYFRRLHCPLRAACPAANAPSWLLMELPTLNRL